MNEVSLRVAWRNLLPTYLTIDPFPFEDHKGRRMVVPAGFPTDGASFPWWLKYAGMVLMLVLLALGQDGLDAFLWALLAQSVIGTPIHRAYADAGVAHDYLYWLGANRAYADCVFLRMILRRARILRIMWLLRWNSHPLAHAVAAVVLAYRFLRAFVMYGAVVLAGGFAYAAHRRRRRLEAAGRS